MRLELAHASMDDAPIERKTDQARAGPTPGIVRWALLLAMILILLAFGLVLALSMRNDRAPATQGSS